MPHVCIVTDSSAQFTQDTFPGNELVTVLPLEIHLNGKVYRDRHELLLTDLPAAIPNGFQTLVPPPSPALIKKTLWLLSQTYHHIILILISGHLHPTVARVREVLEITRFSATVHLIDSQTTSIGLGTIVQAAATAAQNGIPVREIKHYLLGLIPRIYTILCLRSLTYLQSSGQLEPSQAVAGELLGISPLYTMDSGRLVPMHKARSARNLVDTFHEFICEISGPGKGFLLQGNPPCTQESRNLRERILADLPNLDISEITINPTLGAILGPKTLGLVGIERAS